MIKKGLLFSLVVFASLFVLTACPNKGTGGEGKKDTFTIERDFVSLKESGFVPPVIRLGNTYVNDKIESKEKTLSYEYSYLRINEGKFPSEAKDIEQVFDDGRLFHTATINERDAGDASKTKLKYPKLKEANGGEICIGTRFILGLKVKNQVGEEVYKAKMLFTVVAPKAGVMAGSSKTILVPGDQTAFPIGNISVESAGSIATKDVKYDAGKGFTVYPIENAGTEPTGLKFGDFGETNKVILK